MKQILIILTLLITLSCSNEELTYKANLITPIEYNVDRIEGNIVILLSDDLKIKRVNISNFKEEIKEGKKVTFYRDNIKVEDNHKLKNDIIDLQNELTEVKISSNIDI
jgi:hypothetical protein